MPTKTKTITVKGLHKAIALGMSYEEAAEIALKSLVPKLRFNRGEGPLQELDEDDLNGFMAELLRFLARENDHSIRFTAENDHDGRSSWTLECNHPGCPELVRRTLSYDVGNSMYPDNEAEGDEFVFNKFVLEFYGIKKHAERKMTKEEVQNRLKLIRSSIKEHQREIKSLKSEMKRLSGAT